MVLTDRPARTLIYIAHLNHCRYLNSIGPPQAVIASRHLPFDILIRSTQTAWHLENSIETRRRPAINSLPFSISPEGPIHIGLDTIEVMFIMMTYERRGFYFVMCRCP